MTNEWDGAGVPPVGTHCEVTWGDRIAWCECVILPKKSVAIAFGDGWGVNGIEGHEFRRLKTERERALEAAQEAIKHFIANGQGPASIIIWLYNAGMLKLPEDK